MAAESATDVWQEYDCPISGLDFDIFPPHLVKRGDAFHCSGCGEMHTAGVDVEVQQCDEDLSGRIAYSSIEIQGAVR